MSGGTGSTHPDPRPKKRVRDRDLMKRMHLELAAEPCARDCGRIGVALHHKRFRSQSGGDVRENLEWLCGKCHDAEHGL